MNVKNTVVEYYSRSNFAARIVDMAGGAAGLTREKLTPFDEMHVGGHPATLHLVRALAIAPDMRVLDIGCGVGGAARAVAAETGAHVTGVDLTPDFCATATMLSELVDMGEAVAFEVGDATNLRFADAAFDAAYTIHAAMNIEDKAALYREAARVLKPGALFGIYDIMAGGHADALRYPVPWADSAAASFLMTPDDIAVLLRGCGFEIITHETRRDFGVMMLEKALTRVEGDFAVRVQNLLLNIKAEACAPWQITGRKI